MKPELLNRMDEIIIFSPLGGTDLRDIVKLIVDQAVDRASKERSITLSVSNCLIDKILEEGSANPAQSGERPRDMWKTLSLTPLFEDSSRKAKRPPCPSEEKVPPPLNCRPFRLRDTPMGRRWRSILKMPTEALVR